MVLKYEYVWRQTFEMKNDGWPLYELAEFVRQCRNLSFRVDSWVWMEYWLEVECVCESKLLFHSSLKWRIVKFSTVADKFRLVSETSGENFCKHTKRCRAQKCSRINLRNEIEATLFRKLILDFPAGMRTYSRRNMSKNCINFSSPHIYVKLKTSNFARVFRIPQNYFKMWKFPFPKMSLSVWIWDFCNKKV